MIYLLRGVLCVLFAACTCQAALVTTHTDADRGVGATVDGVINAGEYSTYSYTGGGSGFGGALGSGTLYLESDATNLYFGFQPGGTINNLVAVFLDTRAGGFSDDTGMYDVADGGRRVASQLSRDAQDNLPIEADFVLEFGNSFTNGFELTPGTMAAPGSLNFFAPTSAAGAAREASIPLSFLGLSEGDTVDFFAVLISDSGFSSNEGLPDPGFGSNPGFGSGSVTWADHHQFIVAVPEVSPAVVLPFVTAFGLARSRRRLGSLTA